MTSPSPVSDPSRNDLPLEWRTQVATQLAPGENVLAWVQVDLDRRLHFKKGLLALTERRLLTQAPGETGWSSWPFQAGLALRHHDHAGVGHLELVDGSGLLASWRFTLGQTCRRSG